MEDISKSHSLWWQRGVIYQIYPRSFADADGVGDLLGITSKLDYLAWLGINAIWLSPIYPSPMADFGYDITDYTHIHPMFGTLRDFDTLLEEAHQHRIKVILDYVPNHTSDQHPWFQESRSSLDNPRRDCISGAIPRWMVGFPTIGSACLEGQHGPLMSRLDNTTIMPTSLSSPT